MSIQTYPNGIGGLSTSGDPLGLARPLYTSGNVWYVSSLIGTNAASPAGQNREKPLATVTQAYSNAAAGDIIVFLPGHVQLSPNLNINKADLTFVGEGTDASGKPAVQFSSPAAQSLFSIQAGAVGCEFRNIYFPQRAVLATSTRIIVSADDVMFSGCYFECGANDNERAIVISANRARFRRTTFVSTGTLTSAQPKSVIEVSPGAALVGLEITDCVVDAGSVGFSGGISSLSAIDLSGAASVSRLRVEGLSLLHGADANFGVATGRANVQLATGGSRVVWA
jgi:hypothetical protein